VPATEAPADTRQRILDVAAELFTEQGYEGTSLREIADRMGFTKAALYYHFNNKEDLLRALIDPILSVQGELIELLKKANSREEWADVLSWIIDVFFDNARIFGLLERNRAAIENLAESSVYFEEHLQLHEQMQAAVNRPGLPLPDRVRMICALGAVLGFDDLAPRLITDADRAELRSELTLVVREILGLPKRRARR
jgi:AcrR family transcriptional regulator